MDEKQDKVPHAKMTFSEHLEELRHRLMRALMGLAVALVVTLIFGRHVLTALRYPYDQLMTGLGEESVLWVRSMPGGIFLYFRVCLYAGLVLASPWLVYQAWMFVSTGLYPREKRIVLLSDGRETGDGFDQAVRILKEETIDLRVVDLPGISQPEASVIALRPNTPIAYRGERVRMTATLSTNQPLKGTLRFLNRGVVQASAEVELAPDQDNRFSADLLMNTAGSSVWTAELIVEKDHFPLNNRASCTVEV